MRPGAGLVLVAWVLGGAQAFGQDGGLARVHVELMLGPEWDQAANLTLCGRPLRGLYRPRDGGSGPAAPRIPPWSTVLEVPPGPCALTVWGAFVAGFVTGLEDWVEVPPGESTLRVDPNESVLRARVTYDGGSAPEDTIWMISATRDVQRESGGLLFDHRRHGFTRWYGTSPEDGGTDAAAQPRELPVPWPGRFHLLAWSPSTGMAQGWVDTAGPPLELSLAPGVTLEAPGWVESTVLTRADERGEPYALRMRGVKNADGGTLFPHVAGPVRIWNWRGEATVDAGDQPLTVVFEPPDPPGKAPSAPAPTWPPLDEGVPGPVGGHRLAPRTVVGTVRQADGRPAAGAWVLLLCRDDGERRPAALSSFQDCTSGPLSSATPHGRPCVQGSTFTDPDGRFLAQVPTARPLVAVDAWLGDQWAHGVPVQGQWLTLTLDDGQAHPPPRPEPNR